MIIAKYLIIASQKLLMSQEEPQDYTKILPTLKVRIWVRLRVVGKGGLEVRTRLGLRLSICVILRLWFYT